MRQLPMVPGPLPHFPSPFCANRNVRMDRPTTIVTMVVRMQGRAWAPPPRMGGEAREGPRCDLAFARSSERY